MWRCRSRCRWPYVKAKDRLYTLNILPRSEGRSRYLSGLASSAITFSMPETTRAMES
jgi:hypothetical protein